MEQIDQFELTTQLGITSEDASFLQQVLSELNAPDEPEIALTGIDMNAENTLVDVASVVEQANQDPIMQKISAEDNDSTSRFSSAIWYDKIQEQTVILAGLGGIGSYVAFLLSRMHPSSVFIYDDDTVETVNLSGQMFSSGDVGRLKTSAIRSMMGSFSNYGDVFAIDGKFTEQSQPGNIMICGFDNMSARKVFFNKWCAHVRSFGDISDRAKCLYIDGRLAAESFQVFCIKGNDPYAMEKYQEQWLFNDDEAEETVCSYKQTSFCANMIASVMVNCFVNFIANQCNPMIPRDVPFFTEYDASMMFFKTES